MVSELFHSLTSESALTSFQVMKLWNSLPVFLSQVTKVALWVLMPMQARHCGVRWEAEF